MRSPVQAIGGGATMTKEKADYLSEMREKMGLSKEAAEKVIKGVQNQHLISGLQARPRQVSQRGSNLFHALRPRALGACQEHAACAFADGVVSALCALTWLDIECCLLLEASICLSSGRLGRGFTGNLTLNPMRACSGEQGDGRADAAEAAGHEGCRRGGGLLRQRGAARQPVLAGGAGRFPGCVASQARTCYLAGTWIIVAG